MAGQGEDGGGGKEADRRGQGGGGASRRVWGNWSRKTSWEALREDPRGKRSTRGCTRKKNKRRKRNKEAFLEGEVRGSTQELRAEAAQGGGGMPCDEKYAFAHGMRCDEKRAPAHGMMQQLTSSGRSPPPVRREPQERGPSRGARRQKMTTPGEGEAGAAVSARGGGGRGEGGSAQRARRARCAQGRAGTRRDAQRAPRRLAREKELLRASGGGGRCGAALRRLRCRGMIAGRRCWPPPAATATEPVVTPPAPPLPSSPRPALPSPGPTHVGRPASTCPVRAHVTPPLE